MKEWKMHIANPRTLDGYCGLAPRERTIPFSEYLGDLHREGLCESCKRAAEYDVRVTIRRM